MDGKHDLIVPPIAKALARARGIPIQDAAFAARRSWGILEENIGKSQAAELVNFLKKEGVGSVAIPCALMEELPPPKEIQSLELGRGKIRAWLKTGEEEWLSAASLSLIASAGFNRERKAPRPNLPLPRITLEVYPRQEPATPHREEELVFYLDLFASGPSQRLRLDSQDFDYSCLRGRMSYNTLSNFKRLVMTLAGKSTPDHLNRGTRTILDGGPINSMGYESLADLDRESRWLLTLGALNRL